MIEVNIKIPDEGVGDTEKTKQLQTLPRIGDVIKGRHNRFYRVEVVCFQPWEQEETPSIVIIVNKEYGTSPLEALEKAKSESR